MAMTDQGKDDWPESEFLKKARRAFDALFDEARKKDELNFAFSLAPEFKAYTLTSAMDAQRAYEEYGQFLKLEQFRQTPIYARVALAFYCHTAEAAGLWGVPMCMLLVRAGEHYNLEPFSELVKRHKASGQTIAPNANKVMGYMAQEASEQGLIELSEVFRDAFDADVRNGFAHSDYALCAEGVLVRGRHDRQRTITWQEFGELFDNGIGLFSALQQVIASHAGSYEVPKVVTGSINDRDPPGPYLIYQDPIKRTNVILGGPACSPDTLMKEYEARLRPG